LSLQNFIFNVAMRRAQRSLMQLEPEHRLKRSRKMMELVHSRVPEGITIRQEKIAEVAVEWLVPKALANQLNLPVCLYFHGGAFVMGGFNSHRDMAARLAEKAGVTLLMVDYRLAPEHPFPAALDDAVAVYHALLARGTAPARLFMGGDSAGGNIVLATAQALRNSGTRMPCAMFLFSPWVDLRNDSATHRSNAATDAMLNTRLLDEAVQRYAQQRRRDDARLSPLLGSMTGLPPCLIVASAKEILLNDAVDLRDKLQSSGIAVDYVQWSHTPHAFPVLARWLPEARAALDRTALFIQKHAAS
jgi:acetyl esterase/lipase